jgi:inosine-uridine nucleoside N-ribohydrolase
MLTFYLEHAKKDDGALYDPLTILCLLAPDLFTFRPAALGIETEDDSRYGQTRFDLGSGDGRIRVAASCDVPQVRQILLDRLKTR